MKKQLVAMSVLLVGFVSAFPQSPYKVYTSPKLPARDALDRMNLSVAWHARVAVDGQRDGIFSVQLIPGKQNQLVVQTFKGAVYLYNADQGDLIWKSTTVGVPYWVAQPAAWNSQCIFVSRRNVLHVLDRATGAQRVYGYVPGHRDPFFGFELQFSPSAAPVADEDFLYVCMASRLHAVYIPDFEGLERARKAAEAYAKKRDAEKKENGEKKEPMEEKKEPPPENYLDELERLKRSADSPQPFVYWAYKVADQVTDAPAVFHDEIISMLTSTGSLFTVNRYDEGPRKDIYEFHVKGNTPGGAGQHGATAYFGSSDFNVYAVHLPSGRLVWRHIAGAAIHGRPAVNERDIYIAPERLGLRKLERANGREVWTNRDVEKFLAANQSFVYALDKLGKFFVLDTKRGTTLAKADFADWAISLSNEYTDRIYLAANDGQILCLRHRDLTKPLIMKIAEEYKHWDQKKNDEEKKEEKKENGEKKAALEFKRLPGSAQLWPRLEAPRRAWLAEERSWTLR